MDMIIMATELILLRLTSFFSFCFSFIFILIYSVPSSFPYFTFSLHYLVDIDTYLGLLLSWQGWVLRCWNGHDRRMNFTI